jgi:hypothetical protein
MEKVMTNESTCQNGDWVNSPRQFFLVWGLPLLILVFAAFFASPAVKTWAWFAALVWMGGACLVNASRCGRRHCFYTGPFLIVMAVVVVLHGYNVIPLGLNGWWWLFAAITAGGGSLWYLPERLWGRYARPPGSKQS